MGRGELVQEEINFRQEIVRIDLVIFLGLAELYELDEIRAWCKKKERERERDRQTDRQRQRER